MFSMVVKSLSEVMSGLLRFSMLSSIAIPLTLNCFQLRKELPTQQLSCPHDSTKQRDPSRMNYRSSSANLIMRSKCYRNHLANDDPILESYRLDASTSPH